MLKDCMKDSIREIWRIIVPEYVACLLFLNVSNIYLNI